MLKKYLPKSLLGRSILIIVAPLIVLQLVSGTIFYETHWDKVSLRLARGVAGDILAVVSLLKNDFDPANKKDIFKLANENLGLQVVYKDSLILKNLKHKGNGLMERMLIRAMSERTSLPFRIDTKTMRREVIIDVQLSGGVLHITTSRKRLFSSTVYVFVLWMIGTSLILFGVATIFMRNQIKPIRRLAIAAENFGKGGNELSLKPEGANEVRQAALAFLAMRERIQNQIRQRTEMLAGVSHDLRTPLTRMRLELEMLEDDDVSKNLTSDVTDMEHMLDGYISFAQGEGEEQLEEINLNLLIDEITSLAKREGANVDFISVDEIVISLRPNAFKRCLTNIIGNAKKYGENILVTIRKNLQVAEIMVDDDGPGIAKEQWKEVFRPFYRIDPSRNLATGGVGLGLTIVQDIVHSHGGKVSLSISPDGGFRFV